MSATRKFRFPLSALFFVMFYVSGLFTGLAFNWSTTREAKMRYDRLELRLQRRSGAVSKMMDEYEEKRDEYENKLDALNDEAENLD
jgi:hypothetical protein